MLVVWTVVAEYRPDDDTYVMIPHRLATETEAAILKGDDTLWKDKMHRRPVCGFLESVECYKSRMAIYQLRRDKLPKHINFFKQMVDLCLCMQPRDISSDDSGRWYKDINYYDLLSVEDKDLSEYIEMSDFCDIDDIPSSYTETTANIRKAIDNLKFEDTNDPVQYNMMVCKKNVIMSIKKRPLLTELKYHPRFVCNMMDEFGDNAFGMLGY